METDRERILRELGYLEKADEIQTSQGWECPHTTVGCAMIQIFKKIVKDEWMK
jgi:hypothetical protein